MSETCSLTDAKNIMSDNLIGPDELSDIKELQLKIPDDLPPIPYSREELEQKKDDYILIFGASHFMDGRYVTIRNLIGVFGKNPDISEPCFYNQDWYEKEDFIDTPIDEGWFLIRKNVFENSRAVQPVELMKEYSFPSAVRCCYSFFVSWLTKDIKLWEHDFVWCSDTDHNGDRIYIGKYNDVDGVNKNGFSIHRHLALRQCYGCIDT